MPTLVVNDNSWGEGISGLMGGFVKDPKQRAEAMALQARIDASNLAARQTQIENENLLKLRQSREAAATAAEGQLTPEKLSRFVTPTITQPAPSPDFMGPMPQVPNPDLATLPDRLAAARTFARNAILHGTTAEGALKGAYGGLGYGQLYSTGIPQDENQARRLTGLVEGKIPSASVPMTEGARRQQVAEEEQKAVRLKEMEAQAALQREREQQQGALTREQLQEQGRNNRALGADLHVSQDSTVYMSPERRRQLGLPAEGPVQGQVSYGKTQTVIRPNGDVLRGSDVPDPNAPPAAEEPLTGSNAETVVYRRRRLQLEEKHRQGSLTPQELREWVEVDSALHDPKVETRKGENGRNQTVITQAPRPPGSIDPRTLLPPPANPAPGGTAPGGAGTGPQSGPVARTTSADAAAAGVPPAVGGQTKTRTVTDPTTGVQVTTIEGEGQTELATTERANAMAQTGVIEAQANKLKGMLAGGGGKKPYQPTATEMLLGDRARIGEPGLMGTAKDFAVGVAQNLMDPEASVYQTHARGLINALTRLESGAAIGEPERRRYIDMLIPNKLDNTPEKVAAKLQLIDDIVAMRAQGLSNDEIRKWVNRKADEREAASVGGRASAAAPAAASLRLPSGYPVPPGAVKGEFVLNKNTGQMEVVQ
jgi:hypothetical protein